MPDSLLDRNFFPLLILAVLLIVALAAVDAVIIAIWSSDSRRERPILAPRWSLAHLFLAFQAWIFLTVALGIPLTIIVWLALSRLVRLQVPTETAMAWAAIPMLVLQNLAMVAVVLF